METVYITDQGTQLHKEGHRLVVMKGSRRVDEIRTGDLSQIVLMGNITLTPPVMDHLIRDRVDTVFMTMRGRFRGRLMTEYTKNVTLRQQQYQRLSDHDFCLATGRLVVAGKIENMRLFLLRYNRRLRREELGRTATRLRSAGEMLAEARDLDQVRGLEGTAARIYFSVFQHLIQNPDFAFKGRNRRPPRDPVNALLSFAYTLLANAVETQINVVGLDPYLGALHAVEYGRPSLVCDLVEEFRPFLADGLVLALLNRRAITPEDFVHRKVREPPFVDEEDLKENRPVTMKPEVMRAVIQSWENRLATRVKYFLTGEMLTYRYILEQQVRQYARYIMGKTGTYRPVEWSR